MNESRSIKNILLTGPPGGGKTTVVKEAVGRLPCVAGGFFTSDIREKGVRQGFKVESLDGRAGILAHVAISGPHHVGKYGVNVADFERVGVDSLREAMNRKGVIVIDEIGRMELFSERFRSELMRALDSDRPVLATIQQKRDPFLDAIRSRPDTLVLRVSRSNRSHVVEQLLAILSKM